MALWNLSFEVDCKDKEGVELEVEKDICFDVDPVVGDFIQVIPFDSYSEHLLFKVTHREYSNDRWHLDFDRYSVLYAADLRSLAESLLDGGWTVRLQTKEGGKVIESADEVPDD